MWQPGATLQSAQDQHIVWSSNTSAGRHRCLPVQAVPIQSEAYRAK